MCGSVAYQSAYITVYIINRKIHRCKVQLRRSLISANYMFNPNNESRHKTSVSVIPYTTLKPNFPLKKVSGGAIVPRPKKG